MIKSGASLKTLEAKDKVYRVYDTKGLYLEVAKCGGKWWRVKYRLGGKEKRLSLGVYPAVSLKQARVERDKLRDLVANGDDPSLRRKLLRASAKRKGEAANYRERINRIRGEIEVLAVKKEMLEKLLGLTEKNKYGR